MGWTEGPNGDAVGAKKASQKAMGFKLVLAMFFHHGTFVQNYFSLSYCVHSLHIFKCDVSICNDLLCVSERIPESSKH